MNSAWWLNSGTPSHWYDSEVGISSFNWIFDTNWNYIQIDWNAFVDGLPKLFQAPRTVGSGRSGRLTTDPGFNTGYFYLKDGTTGDLLAYAENIALWGDPARPATDNPQWVQLYPEIEIGDILPEIVLDYTSSQHYSAYYKTPFVAGRGNASSFFHAVSFFYQTNNITSGTSVEVWHYMPWAWFGAPPAVFAAIVMQAGLDKSLLDQTAFDNAYDAYMLSTGDEPWQSLDAQHMVYCARRVGDSVFSLLMMVAPHGRDFYYTNEAGQLSVSSFTRPNNTISWADVADHVLDKIEWKTTIEHTFNKSVARWGSAYRASGSAIGRSPEDSDYSVAEEPGLESYAGDKWSSVIENTGSQDKYGVIDLGTVERQVNLTGQPETVMEARFPFILDPGDHTTDTFPLLEYWKNSDGKIRREVTVTHDFIGTDFGLGDKLSDVDFFGDGVTVADMRCVEKEYDFDNLTIKSVLLEIPDNT